MEEDTGPLPQWDSALTPALPPSSSLPFAAVIKMVYNPLSGEKVQQSSGAAGVAAQNFYQPRKDKLVSFGGFKLGQEGTAGYQSEVVLLSGCLCPQPKEQTGEMGSGSLETPLLAPRNTPVPPQPHFYPLHLS